ncbi:ketopantoate reductase family protein [Sorangium sp. So ce1153]|uniref:ketopantoate reductase family protein n=1 Tax=Sorangium sp. So ce1153 TaxID=3133333 RepID=UPI003F61A763
MRILIVGAGAVGGYFGARLALAGEDVTFVARGAHGEAMRSRGLVLRTPAGELRTPPLRVVDLDALDAKRGPFDLALIAVKWPSLAAVSARLPGLLAGGGLAAPLLNGLDSEDAVAREVGESRVIAAIAYMSAGLSGPGEIETLAPTRAGLAPYRSGQEPRVEAVAALLERAGIPVRRGSSYRAMLWEKMVWNAPFNAICALTGQRAGAVVEQMEDLARAAMLEVIAVARAEGAEIPVGIADAMVTLTRAEFPLTEPSMLQDVRAGRETEVDILQGAVVERGRRAGVDTPVLRTLATLVRGLSPRAKTPSGADPGVETGAK